MGRSIRRTLGSLVGVALLAAGALASAGSDELARAQLAAGGVPAKAGALGARGFVENAGQWPAPVRFHARRGGLAAWATDDALWLEARRLVPRPDASAPSATGAASATGATGATGATSAASTASAGRVGDSAAVEVRGTALRLAFEDRAGAAVSARVEGERPLAARASFVAAGRAHTACTVASVRWPALWPGVDLRLREDEHGALAYDLLLAPGADLDAVVLRVDGAERLALDDDGALVLETAHGPLRQRPPVAWTVGPDGATAAAPVRFRRQGERRFGFAAPPRASDAALVVDPGLEWSTFLGDADLEQVLDVTLAPGGDVVLCGVTWTSTFPTTPGAFAETKSGLDDAFVTRLHATGRALVWSTFLGGTGSDVARAVAVLPSGAVVVVGDTGSADFPVTAGAYDTTFGGGASDVFVARLAPDGAALDFATFLGDAGDEYAGDVELAVNGEPVLCGRTSSSAFPVTSGAYDTSYNGGGFVGDAFVCRLAADGSALVFSTFLGGAAADSATTLALAPDETVTVGGTTSSSGFPTTQGAWDRSFDNTGGFGNDAFVTRLAATGGSLVWSTFLGRDGADLVSDLVLDAAGAVLCCGATESSSLATAGALDTSYGGSGDAFAARLSTDGASLDFLTYLGGPGIDAATGLGLDTAGRIAVAGRTTSQDFPTTVGAYDRLFGTFSGSDGSDGFLVRLAPDGSALDYGSFLGGRHEDVVSALAITGDTVLLTGWTSSFDFPTTPGVYDRTYDGSLIADGFVLRMDFAWHPQRYGQAKKNSNNVTPSVYTSGFPSAERDDFHIGLVGGIPFQLAWLIQGAQPFDVPLFGGKLLVGPPFFRHGPYTTGFLGDVYAKLPYHRAFIGQTVYYQFWYRDLNDPWGVGWSDALEVLVYP